MSEVDVDSLRGTHGKLVHVRLGDKDLCFRRPKKAEIVVMNKSQKANPELGVDHAIGLCRNCFVGPGPMKDFDEASDQYCLAFAGSSDFDGVAEALIKLATGEASITVK